MTLTIAIIAFAIAIFFTITLCQGWCNQVSNRIVFAAGKGQLVHHHNSLFKVVMAVIAWTTVFGIIMAKVLQ